MQDAVVPNRAVGYTRESEDGKPQPGPKRINVYTLPARSSSAGGGYSTAPDLLAFDAAMRADKLLSPAWTGWYFSDKSKAPAAGAPPRKHSGGSGFAGGSPGVNAVIETDLDTGYSIVVLSNDDPPSAETVAKKIRQWLGSELGGVAARLARHPGRCGRGQASSIRHAIAASRPGGRKGRPYGRPT